VDFVPEMSFILGGVLGMNGDNGPRIQSLRKPFKIPENRMTAGVGVDNINAVFLAK